MSCAQFKTLRESLGVTTQWVADAVQVNLRTAQRWEATLTPPDDAVMLLEHWLAVFHRQMGTLLDELRTFEDEHGYPDTLEMVRYRTLQSAQRAGNDWPEEMHNGFLRYALLTLTFEGYDLRINYCEEEK